MKKILIVLVCMLTLMLNVVSQEIELKMVQIDTSRIADVTKVNAIEMLETEVTVALYEAVMGERPVLARREVNMETKEESVTKTFVQEGEELYEYPVVAVSACDAIYFCNKLSKLKGLDPVYKVNGETDVTKWNYTPHEGYGITGSIVQLPTNGYRLPTVDEWKYAAKGGEYYKFAGSDDLNEVAWWGKNSFITYHPVAGKKANGYGLYDMVGNVWEWCFEYASVGSEALKSGIASLNNALNKFLSGGAVAATTHPECVAIAKQLGNCYASGLGATLNIGPGPKDPFTMDTFQAGVSCGGSDDVGFRIVRTIK